MNGLSGRVFMFGMAILAGLLLLASTVEVASAHGPGGHWRTQRSYGWEAGPGYGAEQFGYGPGMMNNWEYGSAPHDYQPNMRGNWTGQQPAVEGDWGYQAAPGPRPYGYGRLYSGRGW